MIVRAAAAQIAPDLTSRENTLARVLDTIREAASKGAELIVFPETFVPWYPYFSFVLPPVLSGKEHVRLYEEAVTVPSAATDAVAAAAREHGIVVALGVNERDHGSALQCATAVRRRWHAHPQAPQDHPDVPRADDLGPG